MRPRPHNNLYRRRFEADPAGLRSSRPGPSMRKAWAPRIFKQAVGYYLLCGRKIYMLFRGRGRRIYIIWPPPRPSKKASNGSQQKKKDKPGKESKRSKPRKANKQRQENQRQEKQRQKKQTQGKQRQGKQRQKPKNVSKTRKARQGRILASVATWPEFFSDCERGRARPGCAPCWRPAGMSLRFKYT